MKNFADGGVNVCDVGELLQCGLPADECRHLLNNVGRMTATSVATDDGAVGPGKELEHAV